MDCQISLPDWIARLDYQFGLQQGWCFAIATPEIILVTLSPTGMKIWQVDFYRRPLQDAAGSPLWELVICTPEQTMVAFCPQSQVNAAWLTQQFQQAIAPEKPDSIQVFRPQSVSLIQAACQPLGLAVDPTRRTPDLKAWLQHRATQYPQMEGYTRQPYDPLELDRPAPVPLPENLWGDRWRFASISAQDLVAIFRNRPIPISDCPDAFLPLQLNLPSTQPIPGVIIDGGRQSMQLAQWLRRSRPYALQAIPGDPDGLILEAGLVERWILTTFADPDVVAAAASFRDRQQSAKGLHFLLVQPDDSGMTYTGFWLLKGEGVGSRE